MKPGPVTQLRDEVLGLKWRLFALERRQWPAPRPSDRAHPQPTLMLDEDWSRPYHRKSVPDIIHDITEDRIRYYGKAS